MTNKEIVLRLFKVISPYRTKLLIAMLAMIIVAAFTGAQAYLVKDLLDKIFLEKNVFFLKLLPVIVVVIFFLKGVAYYIYTILLEKVDGQPTEGSQQQPAAGSSRRW